VPILNSLSVSGLHRVYTEQARVHTESTQSDLRNPTQSLHRLIQHPQRVYTDWFRVYTESTQSDLGSTQSLHRLIKHLDKVYTDQFRVYAESSQSLYRVIQVQIFTESTQSLHWAIQIYTASIKSDDRESIQSNSELHTTWSQKVYTELMLALQNLL
jgi:hypothetical protein